MDFSVNSVEEIAGYLVLNKVEEGKLEKFYDSN